MSKRSYRKNIGLMAGVEFFAFLGITSFWILYIRHHTTLFATIRWFPYGNYPMFPFSRFTETAGPSICSAQPFPILFYMGALFTAADRPLSAQRQNIRRRSSPFPFPVPLVGGAGACVLSRTASSMR